MTAVQAMSGSTGAPGPACVYVIGMHRSGTSAVAGLLVRLGLAAPPAHDRIPATTSNQQGHFESKQLVAFNHRLLLRLGGTWTSPPDAPPGWESGAELGDLFDEASRLFASTFPSRPVAWKDPRLCLLLPFWRKVVGTPAAAVFVCRDPLEVAMSLQARDGLGPLCAHALWERYVRRASSDLAGLPTLVADYGRVLDDPVPWCRQVVEFLTDVGVDTAALTEDDVHGVLDPTMRRQRVDALQANEPDGSARRIFETLRSLHGPHGRWSPPELGEEPGWVSDVLSVRSELDSLLRSLHWVERSRAYRLTAWARRPRPVPDGREREPGGETSWAGELGGLRQEVEQARRALRSAESRPAYRVASWLRRRQSIR